MRIFIVITHQHVRRRWDHATQLVSVMSRQLLENHIHSRVLYMYMCIRYNATHSVLFGQLVQLPWSFKVGYFYINGGMIYACKNPTSY